MNRSRAEPAPSSRAELAVPRHRWLLLLSAVLVCAWGALMYRFREDDVYGILGPYAAVVVMTVAVTWRPGWHPCFSPTLQNIGTGIAVGIAMTLATYPLFRLSTALFPLLEAEVASLYSAAHRTTPGVALTWLLVIILAEELLWRGVVLDSLDKRYSPAVGNALSVATYAAAQAGTRSWVVVLMALVCGAIWTWQRRRTRSVVSPLLAHLIWTPVVIVLVPVL